MDVRDSFRYTYLLQWILNSTLRLSFFSYGLFPLFDEKKLTTLPRVKKTTYLKRTVSCTPPELSRMSSSMRRQVPIKKITQLLPRAFYCFELLEIKKKLVTRKMHYDVNVFEMSTVLRFAGHVSLSCFRFAVNFEVYL